MSFKNSDARKLLDALELLREVSIDVSLEKQSISHKIQALLYKKRTVEMPPAELIADMDDDELAWAIAVGDERIGDILNPFMFNYLKRYRGKALHLSSDLINRI